MPNLPPAFLPSADLAAAGDLAAGSGALLPARASIRLAGLTDIPAIARITQEGPQPTGVEPEMLARATRLVLTHLAFEHGSLWVQNGPDGSIARAVAAVPARAASRGHMLRRDIFPDLGDLAARPRAVEVASRTEHADPRVQQADPGGGLRAALVSVAPSWILAEVSRASLNESGDPALLSAALRWTRGQIGTIPGPIVVLADTEPERAAAQWLGFVEPRGGAGGSAWWLGLDPESVDVIVA